MCFIVHLPFNCKQLWDSYRICDAQVNDTKFCYNPTSWSGSNVSKQDLEWKLIQNIQSNKTLTIPNWPWIWELSALKLTRIHANTKTSCKFRKCFPWKTHGGAKHHNTTQVFPGDTKKWWGWLGLVQCPFVTFEVRAVNNKYIPAGSLLFFLIFAWISLERLRERGRTVGTFVYLDVFS